LSPNTALSPLPVHLGGLMAASCAEATHQAIAGHLLNCPIIRTPKGFRWNSRTVRSTLLRDHGNVDERMHASRDFVQLDDVSAEQLDCVRPTFLRDLH
jgi:hypothetical protein